MKRIIEGWMLDLLDVSGQFIAFAVVVKENI